MELLRTNFEFNYKPRNSLSKNSNKPHCPHKPLINLFLSLIMSKPRPPNLGEGSRRSYTSAKDQYHQKAKGMCFFASILCIFIYTFIFYIFNISPSTLFNTTKFWFFISNTLILIIAVDYGAYSSSKEKQDIYGEYMLRSNVKNASSFASQYPSTVVKESDHELEISDVVEQTKEVISQESLLFPERNLEVVVVKNDSEEPTHEDPRLQKPQVLTPEGDKIQPRTYNYRRSESDKAKQVVIDESKNTLRRSETQKHEPAPVEENEFSTMSDEELNRRVEEFIRRFNRQIRLQAATRNSIKIENS